MRSLLAALAIVALTLTGCGKTQDASHAADARANGMMGEPMSVAQGTQLMTMMGGQLDSLGTMTPAQMTAAMPAHEALSTQMLGTMGSGMQGMSMQNDAGWMALNDSVRQDLTAMPGLSGDALQARMQAHIGRMRRMMIMYQGMPHN